MEDGVSLGVLVWLVAVATSTWVVCDAKANEISTDGKPYGPNNGALNWFAACVILWLVAFPYYLAQRSKVLRDREWSELRDRTKLATGELKTPVAPDNKATASDQCSEGFVLFRPEQSAGRPEGVSRQAPAEKPRFYRSPVSYVLTIGLSLGICCSQTWFEAKVPPTQATQAHPTADAVAAPRPNGETQDLPNQEQAASGPAESSSSSPAVGEEGRLGEPSGPWEPLPTTEEALGAYMKASQADDKVGIGELVDAGKLYVVTPGTHVRVIDRGGFLWSNVRVRVLEGPHGGKTGWVPAEAVKRL